MTDYPPFKVSAIETSLGRRISFQFRGGTSHVQLEEARELIFAFDAAITRANDPTPIPSEYKPAAPIKARPAQATLTLADLGLIK